MNVLLPKQFNVDKIKYSEMKIMKSGAKSVYLNYQGSKINIQTPVLSIPYGVNDNTQFIKDDPKRKDEARKYDITASFKGMDENPKVKAFHDKLIELENKICEDASKNSVAWFKKNFEGNKGAIENMFSPIVRRDKDKETGIDPAMGFSDLGFHILATDGTALFLREHGIECTTVRKNSEGTGAMGEKTIVDIINAGEIDLVINTPVGRGTRADGWAIRTAAVQRSIPCITTTAGFSAAVDAITFLQSSPLSIKSLQEWLA